MNAKASFISPRPIEEPTLSSADFRDAMARVPGAVTIVGGQDRGVPYGIVVSSLTALSIDPPRVLFCIRKEASCHEQLLRIDDVSLNVLAATDRAEAEAFADRSFRFTSDRWRHVSGEPPRLEGARISMVGWITQRICAGENTIFVVDIAQSRHNDAEPLLYHLREFRELQPRQ